MSSGHNLKKKVTETQGDSSEDSANDGDDEWIEDEHEEENNRTGGAKGAVKIGKMKTNVDAKNSKSVSSEKVRKKRGESTEIEEEIGNEEGINFT